jgi:hypothetical protein
MSVPRAHTGAGVSPKLLHRLHSRRESLRTARRVVRTKRPSSAVAFVLVTAPRCAGGLQGELDPAALVTPPVGQTCPLVPNWGPHLRGEPAAGAGEQRRPEEAHCAVPCVRSKRSPPAQVTSVESQLSEMRRSLAFRLRCGSRADVAWWVFCWSSTPWGPSSSVCAGWYPSDYIRRGTEASGAELPAAGVLQQVVQLRRSTDCRAMSGSTSVMLQFAELNWSDA